VNPVRLWQAFWFPAVPIRRLAAFRIVMAGAAFVDIWIVSGWVSRLSHLDGDFYRPVVLLRPFPRLGPELTTAIWVVLVVALAMATVGLFTRAALLVAAPLYFWWWATYYSYGTIMHTRITTLAALVVLIVAPAGRAWSLDALRRRRHGRGWPAPGNEGRDQLAGWALRVMMVLVVAAYMLAAWAKLKMSGVGWVTGGAVEAVLIEHGMLAGDLLVRYPLITRSMAALTLILEASAFVLFFRGRIRDAYFAAAILFHLGTLILLDINFLLLLLAYLAFYDLEVGVARVGRAIGAAGSRELPLAR
jgi:hypothetical protein